jgi:RimJ/RimL family protein N-acetyltransferase
MMSEEIRTARLLLRRVRPSDAGQITAFVQDPLVHRMLASVAPNQTKAQTLAWIAGHDAGAARDSDHVWAIELDNQLVGVTGAHRSNTCLPFEVGYWLAPQAWGKGLMTEALGALLDWLEQRGEKAFVSGHFADNPASGRVLQKLGFIHAGRNPVFCLGRGEMVDHLYMARIARNA